MHSLRLGEQMIELADIGDPAVYPGCEAMSIGWKMSKAKSSVLDQATCTALHMVQEEAEGTCHQEGCLGRSEEVEEEDGTDMDNTWDNRLAQAAAVDRTGQPCKVGDSHCSFEPSGRDRRGTDASPADHTCHRSCCKP